MAEQFRILEYPLLILFVIVGGVFLISCSDLISVFLSIELQSYGLYILCTVYRNSERATSAGLTYFLLGGLSSCFILLASSLIYGNSGNTSFDGLYVINNISSVEKNFTQKFFHWYESTYILFSFIILSVGFLFKISAAPFHFWSPDVYDAIPTIVTTFVAIFTKISLFILMLELIHHTINLLQPEGEIPTKNTFLNLSWSYSLLISSLLSLLIGAILGLTQFRIKRLYAYSTISHVGFLLLALSINSIESVQSFLFYLMQYTITNLNAFILLLAMGYYLYLFVEKKDKQFSESLSNEKIDDNISTLKDNSAILEEKNNSPIQLIGQIKGYYYINPVLAISLALTLFSFAGIPPLMGFFAKQMILSSALDNGYVFMAIIAILTSVISAYYYLVLVKQMFFHKSNYELNPELNNITLKGNIINKNIPSFLSLLSVSGGSPKNYKTINIILENIVISSSLSTTVSVLTLTIFFFILIPQEWLNLANILALILFNV